MKVPVFCVFHHPLERKKTDNLGHLRKQRVLAGGCGLLVRAEQRFNTEGGTHGQEGCEEERW